VTILKSSSNLQPSSTRNDEIGRNRKSVNFKRSLWSNAYSSLLGLLLSEKAKNIAPIARHSVRAPVLSDLHRPKKVPKRCTQRRSPRTSHRSSPRRREFSAYIKNEERKMYDIDSLKTRRKTRVKRLLLWQTNFPASCLALSCKQRQSFLEFSIRAFTVPLVRFPEAIAVTSDGMSWVFEGGEGRSVEG
ncbi:hypothetical protein V1477_010213, partial [Vespula maculifrons]